MKNRTPHHLEVYYDGRCGLCCTFHEWLHVQERAFPVRFITYQSEEAEEVFPGLNALHPERDMIVRTDDGIIHRAGEGWVLCLMSCARYQWLARRLASPVLLPFAEKICRALASRRYRISKLFFRKKDRDVAAALHAMPERQRPLESRHHIPDGII